MDVVENFIGYAILHLESRHGSLRAAARAVKIDPAYLGRLKYGEKTNPSEKVLKKLGLKKKVIYECI